jgi:hypothetical protein
MSHQDRWLLGRGPWSLLAHGCERLAHHFGFGKSTFPRDSLKESGSLRIDSDIQGSHVAFVSQRVIQGHSSSVRASAAGEFVHFGEFVG